MSKKEKKPTFEDNMARLHAIVAALETGELPLEQGLALYKEGTVLSHACRTELEHAKNEIRILTEAGFTPFEAAPTTEHTP